MTKEQQEAELLKYYRIYTAPWKLFKKHYPPTDIEEFWNSLREDSRELVGQYPEQERLITDLILATNNEIIRIQKRGEEPWNNEQNQSKA